jgi:threonine dehydratase
MTEPRISYAEIERAVAHIDPVFLRTPQFECEPLRAVLGARVALKIETLNPIRSFKGRGAELLVSRRDAATPLVCASAGNFGQAMAYACRRRSIALTVFASTRANPFKIERMRDLGAEVVLAGEDFDGAKTAARAAAAAAPACFVEDGADVETVLGAGTIGLEWAEFTQPLDALLVPLGNGALFNGVARAFEKHSPHTRRIAVQAAGAPALADMQGLADEMFLVREASILEAMRLLHRHAGIVAEPAAAVGIAAMLENRDRFRDQLVGTIVCGGNLATEQMRAWL